MKQSAITWKSKRVAVASVDPTPTNYKIKSDIGKARLDYSLKQYGRAGTIVCNYAPKGRFVIIDGNSRIEAAKERKEKYVEISVPSRQLTAKEFKEMSAMFDFAKAGEVDVERIEGDLGTSQGFFKSWNLNIPLHLLSNIGKTAKGSVEVAPGKISAKKTKALQEVKASEMRLVQLSFTEQEERLFREAELVLIKRWATSSTMATVLRAMQTAIKK